MACASLVTPRRIEAGAGGRGLELAWARIRSNCSHPRRARAESNCKTAEHAAWLSRTNGRDMSRLDDCARGTLLPAAVPHGGDCRWLRPARGGRSLIARISAKFLRNDRPRPLGALAGGFGTTRRGGPSFFHGRPVLLTLDARDNDCGSADTGGASRAPTVRYVLGRGREGTVRGDVGQGCLDPPPKAAVARATLAPTKRALKKGRRRTARVAETGRIDRNVIQRNCRPKPAASCRAARSIATSVPKAGTQRHDAAAGIGG